MKKVRLEEMSLEEFRKIMDDINCEEHYYSKTKVSEIEDECGVECELYSCKAIAFQYRGERKRNDDFYKSQHLENNELEKLLS